MTVATGERTLPRPRDVSGEFGLYVHIPFCEHRCFYCDFNAYAGLDHLAPDYMRALARDAASTQIEPRPPVTSIFVGGGTPSLVEADQLVAVLDAIRGAWEVTPDCEVTVECNPENVTRDKLERYLAGGVNRVSFGVQSLDDGLLEALGRIHDAQTALAAIATARSAGFDRVNADLIFGVPRETDETWRRSVGGVLDAGATHVSCYGLTYEEGTPLHEWRKLGRVVPVAEDDVARRWEAADGLLTDAGLERYEISNWTTPGEACRHNRLYWACGEYVGVGAGAHSHVADEAGSTRSWTLKSPERYIRTIEAGERPLAGAERIDADGRAAEAMFLGLRRTEGVSARGFEALTGASLEATFGAELAEASALDLLAWDGHEARLTPRGTLLANEALTRFL